MIPSVLAYIPSPSTSGISVGPVRLHVYGLMIALGIAAAVWLAQRRWEAIGGAPGTMAALAVWGVPGGLIGARVYSLITSWNVDTNGGRFLDAFQIWRGGLGIWGGVIGGIALGAVGVRRAGLRLAPLLDCVAPAFALAQAVGRWGNYFNQELYGRPSHLPWAVKIDNPPGYPAGTTFQPTFLYECLWDLIVCVLVIAVERRFRIRRGYLLAAYAALYTFGRFFTEYLRIDDAHRFLGLRLNDWTSVVVFVAASVLLFTRGRARPGDECAGDPLTPDDDTEEAGSGEDPTADDEPPPEDSPGDGTSVEEQPTGADDPPHGAGIGSGAGPT